MTRRYYYSSLSVFITLSFCLAAFADQPAPRTPAPVMTFHGAEWLERPEREQEEMPAEVIKTMGLKPGEFLQNAQDDTDILDRMLRSN